MTPAVARQAVEIAREVLDAMDVVGVLCVEFFLTADDRLLVNELAPRPHNSGHFTIDACLTSQFEQQLRAVCGLPLGSTEQLRPAAMANLLAGNTSMALDSINFTQMQELQDQWKSSNAGMASFTVGSLNAIYIQHRPELASPKAVLDVRVHRALAYALDRQTLADHDIDGRYRHDKKVKRRIEPRVVCKRLWNFLSHFGLLSAEDYPDYSTMAGATQEEAGSENAGYLAVRSAARR